MDKTLLSNPPAPSRLRRMRGFLMGTTLAVAATVGLSAWAHGHGHGGPMGGHAAHRMVDGGLGGGMAHGMARHLDRMLDGLGATDAQRDQVRQIAQVAAADLAEQRQAGQALHAQGLAVFTAAEVDPAAVEQVRLQTLAQHDQMSRRITQALLDISKVLTPEQRVQLGQRINDRAGMMKERRQRMHDERQRRDAPAQK